MGEAAEKWAKSRALMFIKSFDNPDEGARYKELLGKFRDARPDDQAWLYAGLGLVAWRLGMDLEAAGGKRLEDKLKELEAEYLNPPFRLDPKN